MIQLGTRMSTMGTGIEGGNSINVTSTICRQKEAGSECQFCFHALHLQCKAYFYHVKDTKSKRK